MAGADFTPNPALLRFPDISASHIAFVYAGDIYIAPRSGENPLRAYPLTTIPGVEGTPIGPRFSPDGTMLAYSANYDGNRDLYTIAVSGGAPTRCTFHPDSEALWDWTPDGRLLFSSSAFCGIGRQSQIFTLKPGEALPVRLPVPYGAEAAISPDGKTLAYAPLTSSAGRTWKRYQGGQATDLWLFDLDTRAARKATNWPGDDGLPMWHGSMLYYLSSQGESNTLNIWSCDSTADAHAQNTHLSEYDVKYPAIGPGDHGQGEIIYQAGAGLVILELATQVSTPVVISIPGDRPAIRSRSVNAAANIVTSRPAPTAKRIVIEARGDVWTAPAEKGSPRNLTRSNGAAERDPAWSPDGRWIACFSDARGEYQLTLIPSDATGQDSGATQIPVTQSNDRFLVSPVWAPDSKHIAYSDNAGAIWIASAGEGGWAGSEPQLVDQDTWGEGPQYEFSPDSRYLVYTKQGVNHLAALHLWNLELKTSTQLTSGRFFDSAPTFSLNGDWLAFASQRDFSAPQYENIHGLDFVYSDTQSLYVVPLRSDVKNPFAPTSDEEAGDKSADEAKEKDAEKEAGAGRMTIETEGFESRAIRLPVPSGQFSSVAFTHDHKVVYARVQGGGIDEAAVQIFDPADDKREQKMVIAGVSSFSITPDGKKLLVAKGSSTGYIDPAPDQKLEKTINLADLPMELAPQAEWNQIFTDAWRMVRQFFYDPSIHHLDWNAVRTRYSAMAAECASREDLAFVLGEMIGELNTSHAYIGAPGDVTQPASRSVGLLGCDFALENGAFRIARIIRGAPWDADARSPLLDLGVNVKEGQYLLAVNGVPVDISRSPYSAFQGLAGKTTSITISDSPTLDDSAREALVTPIGSEAGLRYRDWIERNRAYVAERTGNRVGYIHVPNTGINGQNELHRQYFGQVDLPALIIDERWNGGGQTSDRFIDLMHRPILNYRVRRYGLDIAWPPDAHQGPKCMLINGAAGSGGDLFPYYFRKRGVGPLIGMRTWGGIVGLTGNPAFIDGGSITIPTRAFFETDGTWGIEGHGVAPDIEVVDDPALMASDDPYEIRDPQLDAAIAEMLRQLEVNPYVPAKRPAYPNRSGAGLPEDEH